jgi:hypothetical protein
MTDLVATVEDHETRKSTTQSYARALADSLKVNWKVEDVLRPGEHFDFTRPFLPDALAGVEGIPELEPADRLVLNQVRGKTYLYLFGFVEEFILPFVLDQARRAVHGDPARTRGLVTFAEEEAKHIDLFRRFEAEFDRAFPTRVGVIGPAEAVAAQVLSHSTLGIALVILHLEWLTQEHYLASVRGDISIDTRFAGLLKHHWQEEAQHAKLDTLLIQELAAEASPQEIERAFDDYLSIAALLDGGLAAQVDLDIDALERHRGRRFDPADRAGLVAQQTRSYRRTFLVQGARHPSFVATLEQLSLDGAARVASVAARLDA